MSERSESFSQNPIEDKDWDRSILGDCFEAYADVVRSGRDDADRVRTLIAQVAGADPVPPLAQALLANVLGDVVTPATTSSGRTSASPAHGEQRSRRTSSVHAPRPLVHRTEAR